MASRSLFLPGGVWNPYPDTKTSNGMIPHTIGSNDIEASRFDVEQFPSSAVPNLVVEWVRQGRLEVKRRDSVEVLEEGQALVMVVPVSIRYRGLPSDPSSRFRDLWMATSDPFLVEWVLRRFPMRWGVMRSMSEGFSNRFLDLFLKLRESAPKDRLAVFAECDRFWREAVEHLVPARALKPRGRQGAEELLARVERAGEKRFSIASVAKGMGLSREHFSRKFRERIGLSPRQAVEKTRMDALVDLLETTELSTSDASERAGFRSYRQAALTFRRVKGVTMSEWREGRKR